MKRSECKLAKTGAAANDDAHQSTWSTWVRLRRFGVEIKQPADRNAALLSPARHGS